MCRSIKRLRGPDGPASAEEIREAALQYVRKVSGFRAPSSRNAKAFEAAIEEVAASSRKLIDAMTHGRARGEGTEARRDQVKSSAKPWPSPAAAPRSSDSPQTARRRSDVVS